MFLWVLSLLCIYHEKVPVDLVFFFHLFLEVGKHIFCLAKGTSETINFEWFYLCDLFLFNRQDEGP